MNEKILFLECRGCYFNDNDITVIASDVGNYRVCTTEYIPFKNGRDYFLEFTRCQHRNIRKHHKTSGKLLKHYITEIITENGLHIGTQFENEKGAWRDSQLESDIFNKHLEYTKQNILNVVNEYSTIKYSKIVLISSNKILDRLTKIYKIGGWREKNILDNLVEIKTKQYNPNYWVFTFYDNNNNLFDYEYYSNRITG